METRRQDGLHQVRQVQAAFRAAVQLQFQVEDSEIAGSPLPTADARTSFLLYEAGEGGAGVLRHLVDDPQALPALARTALERCHFALDADGWQDKGAQANGGEGCVAACYECLLSYTNQYDHDWLDRHIIKDWLEGLAGATVTPAAGHSDEPAHLDVLRAASNSLEQQWLDTLVAAGHLLPNDAQRTEYDGDVPIAKPDFTYLVQGAKVAIFIDGPIHDSDDAHLKDVSREAALQAQGFMCLRFSYKDVEDWPIKLAEHTWLFGAPASAGTKNGGGS